MFPNFFQKKKKFWRIYQNLPEFLHVKNRTFNFNRTHKREDVLRERSEERDGYMVKRITL